MAAGLYSGASGLAVGTGLYRGAAGLYGGAPGLLRGDGGAPTPTPGTAGQPIGLLLALTKAS